MQFSSLFSEVAIIDDDALTVRKTRILLQNAGYIVKSIPLVELEHICHGRKTPDILCVDADISDADGNDSIRCLRGRKDIPYIPIIVLFNEGSLEKALACLNAGADDLIEKPINNDLLLPRVRVMLRLKLAVDNLSRLNNQLEENVKERTRQLELAHSQLRHTEKLASMGRLAGAIVHEINNPLTAMSLSIDLLQDSLPGDSPAKPLIVNLSKQLEQLGTLSAQLKNYSKPPTENREWASINEIIQSLVVLLDKQFRKDDITVKLDLESDIPNVFVSVHQINEVILNLAINAIDAMPEGGELTISTRYKDDLIEVLVMDNGAGIPPDVLEHIFEPYYTTKGERGSGLGLAISYNIIQQHGGQIIFTSETGKGTQVKVTLPIHSTPTDGNGVEG